MKKEISYQKCIDPFCGATFDCAEALSRCSKCNNLLDVVYETDRMELPSSLEELRRIAYEQNDPWSRSGVWRYHALLPFVPREQAVTIGEGQTWLQQADALAEEIGMNKGGVFLQYEGLNPSGSFKDNGMSAAFSHARMVGARRAACASTGNTSASLALYASATRLVRALVFIGSGKISQGKLSQALDYGAMTLQIQGDFDDAMARVREIAPRLGIYLVNSVNPFRLEGQKTIMFRVLEGLNWEVPDWIVLPGGNLGNASAFAKAFHELKEWGLVDRLPRFAVINAAGARTLEELYNRRQVRWGKGRGSFDEIEKYYAELDAGRIKASTIASAIEINRPVNLLKCLRALEWCNGVVEQVEDAEILDAKAQIARGGLGCEPASAASVAGLKKLVQRGIIQKEETVVCILTGHQLKDQAATIAYHSGDAETFNSYLASRGIEKARYANSPHVVANDLEEIVRTIESN